MKVSFESRGDMSNLEAWLKSVTQGSPSAALKSIAEEGEMMLRANTPVDTGETARGWESKIVSKGDTHEIAWYNQAHPENRVSIAVLIDQGHGTGTGGYVQPRPYIQKSMDAVWKDAGNKIYKELVK